jgi:hypothetical protein
MKKSQMMILRKIKNPYKSNLKNKIEIRIKVIHYNLFLLLPETKSDRLKRGFLPQESMKRATRM